MKNIQRGFPITNKRTDVWSQPSCTYTQTFGGCEGNGNRYTTQSECESVCLLQEEPLASGAENEEFWAAICKMDIDEG